MRLTSLTRNATAAALLAAAPAIGAQAPAAAAIAAHHLMPMPASVQFDAGRFPLDASFTVAITHFRDPRLERAVTRALHRLAARTGLDLATTPARRGASAAAPFTIDVRGPGQAVQSVTEDESYSIDIAPEHGTLKAATVVGALRGLETLLQLVESDSGGYFLPLTHIQDRPRFPWRGLLIDVSRHWEPVEVIERNLDAMAMVKLNVLHWHLSDDQGFRVESRRYPKLQELGSNGQYYTQQEIRDVVAYARDRGIRVVPEFDMPGHSASWLVGYPHLASEPGPYAIAQTFGGADAAFDPTRESVYHFIDRFIGEMSALFPDAYWHIGGDEVNGNLWDANPRIRRFMRRHRMTDDAALQAYFNRRLERILRTYHKRMIGWDEILNPDLPKSIIIQSWRGQGSLIAGAQQGFKGILSAGYYLDAMQSAAVHYAVDPIPAGSDLDSTQAARILGGEACMWGELVTPENIDSRIWPRTAAIAERLWSPQSVTDASDMYRRLAFVNVELEELGITHLADKGMMLRRIAGSDAIDPLRALMRVVEPVSLGQRMHARRPTTTAPLVAPGDIAVPDAPAGREVGRMVDSLLRNGAQRQAYGDSLAQRFRAWRALAPAIAAMAGHEPALRDADSAATTLARLGAAGEDALSYLLQGAQPPAEWMTAKLALVDSAATPKGLLRISVVPALRSLITATGGTSTPAK